VREDVLREREVLVARVRARAHAGDALVNCRGGIRHGADDRHTARDPLLDRRRRNRRRDREHRLLRRDDGADLAEQHVEVLRLHGDDEERRTGDGLLVREGRPDAVPLSQLGDALGTPAGRDHLVGPSPARAEEAGDQRLPDLPRSQNGETAAVHGHGESL
jgi:hypothetical protein